MDRTRARKKVKERLVKTVQSSSPSPDATFLIHSDSRDIHWPMAYSTDNGSDADPTVPFHAMSVGKTFTTTLVGMLHDAGELHFDDPISQYLSDDVLGGLHVYRGTDYTDDVQIHHLMSNTSGLPHLLSDEFGLLRRQKEQSPEGKTFLDV